MTTEQQRPCPRSWGDGYVAGYRRAIKDAAQILDTQANRSNPMTIFDCSRAIRALAPKDGK